jgi:hypothetical protein
MHVDDDLIARIVLLHGRRYRFVLDDVTQPNETFAKLLPYAEAIKIDITRAPAALLPKLTSVLKSAGKLLIAAGLDAQADFETAHGLGFDRFQGYFFARPQTSLTRRVSAPRHALRGRRRPAGSRVLIVLIVCAAFGVCLRAEVGLRLCRRFRRAYLELVAAQHAVPIEDGLPREAGVQLRIVRGVAGICTARIFDCNGAHCGPPRGAAPALAAVLWFSPHGNARGVFIVCDVALATATSPSQRARRF